MLPVRQPILSSKAETTGGKCIGDKWALAKRYVLECWTQFVGFLLFASLPSRTFGTLFENGLKFSTPPLSG